MYRHVRAAPWRVTQNRGGKRGLVWNVEDRKRRRRLFMLTSWSKRRRLRGKSPSELLRSRGRFPCSAGRVLTATGAFRVAYVVLEVLEETRWRRYPDGGGW